MLAAVSVSAFVDVDSVVGAVDVVLDGPAAAVDTFAVVAVVGGVAV